MRMISSVPSSRCEMESDRISSSVTTPPALRMTWASPSLSPRSPYGFNRASMQATTATRFPGGSGRSPRSKSAAYRSAFRRSSSVTLIVPPSVLAHEKPLLHKVKETSERAHRRAGAQSSRTRALSMWSECITPREVRIRAELLLDPQQLVVLGETFGLCKRADLDLARRRADGEIGDEAVFGLSRARRDDRCVPLALRLLDHVHCLGEGAYLVHLHEHGVRDTLCDAAREPRCARREEIVAEDLNATAQPGGQQRPSLPVVLGDAVLDRDEGISLNETFQGFDHSGRIGAGRCFGQAVEAVVEEMGRGDVDGECDLVAESAARAVNRRGEKIERRLRPGKRRCEPALRVEAAAEDVHHRKRKYVTAAQMPPERNPIRVRCRMRRGDRHSQDRVRTEPGFVGRAVELDQHRIEPPLVERRPSDEGRTDRSPHLRNGCEDAVAIEPACIVIPQLPRLVPTGRSTRRHAGPAECAVCQLEIDLDGRTAARIEHLSRADRRDGRFVRRHAAARPTTPSASSSVSGDPAAARYRLRGPPHAPYRGDTRQATSRRRARPSDSRRARGRTTDSAAAQARWQSGTRPRSLWRTARCRRSPRGRATA